MFIHTSDQVGIAPFISQIGVPAKNSHKGQNGKLLIVGGSSLFHSASLWSAEIASKILDMVHYSSTVENQEIFLKLKTLFRNGIVVERRDMASYVLEDEAVLVGPGMVRTDFVRNSSSDLSFEDILACSDEGTYTRELVRFLLTHYPHKQFVIDAGALQMMDAAWLKTLKTPALITPHQFEFEHLFEIHINSLTESQKIEVVKQTAAEHHCIILMKAVIDIVSDGKKTVVIKGGNAGLTKGGTGDVLAGLAAALSTKNDPFVSAVVASWLLKKSAEHLQERVGLWFNTSELISEIPAIFKSIEYNQ